jgi:hypothetical protein
MATSGTRAPSRCRTNAIEGLGIKAYAGCIRHEELHILGPDRSQVIENPGVVEDGPCDGLALEDPTSLGRRPAPLWECEPRPVRASQETHQLVRRWRIIASGRVGDDGIYAPGEVKGLSLEVQEHEEASSNASGDRHRSVCGSASVAA